ncbi:unnamed protein product [Amoebophrya sp. A120]|nr:unnamed protein product [Amoebophrya sp. A120]|eukprot:GSA120T00004288001.1
MSSDVWAARIASLQQAVAEEKERGEQLALRHQELDADQHVPDDSHQSFTFLPRSPSAYEDLTLEQQQESEVLGPGAAPDEPEYNGQVAQEHEIENTYEDSVTVTLGTSTTTPGIAAAVDARAANKTSTHNTGAAASQEPATAASGAVSAGTSTPRQGAFVPGSRITPGSSKSSYATTITNNSTGATTNRNSLGKGKRPDGNVARRTTTAPGASTPEARGSTGILTPEATLRSPQKINTASARTSSPHKLLDKIPSIKEWRPLKTEETLIEGPPAAPKDLEVKIANKYTASRTSKLRSTRIPPGGRTGEDGGALVDQQSNQQTTSEREIEVTEQDNDSSCSSSVAAFSTSFSLKSKQSDMSASTFAKRKQYSSRQKSFSQLKRLQEEQNVFRDTADNGQSLLVNLRSDLNHIGTTVTRSITGVPLKKHQENIKKYNDFVLKQANLEDDRRHHIGRKPSNHELPKFSKFQKNDQDYSLASMLSGTSGLGARSEAGFDDGTRDIDGSSAVQAWPSGDTEMMAPDWELDERPFLKTLNSRSISEQARSYCDVRVLIDRDDAAIPVSKFGVETHSGNKMVSLGGARRRTFGPFADVKVRMVAGSGRGGTSAGGTVGSSTRSTKAASTSDEADHTNTASSSAAVGRLLVGDSAATSSSAFFPSAGTTAPSTQDERGLQTARLLQGVADIDQIRSLLSQGINTAVVFYGDFKKRFAEMVARSCSLANTVADGGDAGIANKQDRGSSRGGSSRVVSEVGGSAPSEVKHAPHVALQAFEVLEEDVIRDLLNVKDFSEDYQPFQLVEHPDLPIHVRNVSKIQARNPNDFSNLLDFAVFKQGLYGSHLSGAHEVEEAAPFYKRPVARVYLIDHWNLPGNLAAQLAVVELAPLTNPASDAVQAELQHSVQQQFVDLLSAAPPKSESEQHRESLASPLKAGPGVQRRVLGSGASSADHHIRDSNRSKLSVLLDQFFGDARRRFASFTVAGTVLGCRRSRVAAGGSGAGANVSSAASSGVEETGPGTKLFDTMQFAQLALHLNDRYQNIDATLQKVAPNLSSKRGAIAKQLAEEVQRSQMALHHAYNQKTGPHTRVGPAGPTISTLASKPGTTSRASASKNSEGPTSAATAAAHSSHLALLQSLQESSMHEFSEEALGLLYQLNQRHQFCKSKRKDSHVTHGSRSSLLSGNVVRLAKNNDTSVETILDCPSTVEAPPPCLASLPLFDRSLAGAVRYELQPGSELHLILTRKLPKQGLAAGAAPSNNTNRHSLANNSHYADDLREASASEFITLPDVLDFGCESMAKVAAYFDDTSASSVLQGRYAPIRMKLRRILDERYRERLESWAQQFEAITGAAPVQPQKSAANPRTGAAPNNARAALAADINSGSANNRSPCEVHVRVTHHVNTEEGCATGFSSITLENVGNSFEIFVNGRMQLGKICLRNHDTVQLGPYLFELQSARVFEPARALAVWNDAANLSVMQAVYALQREQEQQQELELQTLQNGNITGGRADLSSMFPTGGTENQNAPAVMLKNPSVPLSAWPAVWQGVEEKILFLLHGQDDRVQDPTAVVFHAREKKFYSPKDVFLGRREMLAKLDEVEQLAKKLEKRSQVFEGRSDGGLWVQSPTSSGPVPGSGPATGTEQMMDLAENRLRKQELEELAKQGRETLERLQQRENAVKELEAKWKGKLKQLFEERELQNQANRTKKTAEHQAAHDVDSRASPIEGGGGASTSEKEKAAMKRKSAALLKREEELAQKEAELAERWEEVLNLQQELSVKLDEAEKELSLSVAVALPSSRDKEDPEREHGYSHSNLQASLVGGRRNQLTQDEDRLRKWEQNLEREQQILELEKRELSERDRIQEQHKLRRGGSAPEGADPNSSSFSVTSQLQKPASRTTGGPQQALQNTASSVPSKTVITAEALAASADQLSKANTFSLQQRQKQSSLSSAAAGGVLSNKITAILTNAATAREASASRTPRVFNNNPFAAATAGTIGAGFAGSGSSMAEGGKMPSAASMMKVSTTSTKTKEPPSEQNKMKHTGQEQVKEIAPAVIDEQATDNSHSSATTALAQLSFQFSPGQTSSRPTAAALRRSASPQVMTGEVAATAAAPISPAANNEKRRSARAVGRSSPSGPYEQPAPPRDAPPDEPATSSALQERGQRDLLPTFSPLQSFAVSTRPASARPSTSFQLLLGATPLQSKVSSTAGGGPGGSSQSQLSLPMSARVMPVPPVTLPNNGSLHSHFQQQAIAARNVKNLLPPSGVLDPTALALNKPPTPLISPKPKAALDLGGKTLGGLKMITLTPSKTSLPHSAEADPPSRGTVAANVEVQRQQPQMTAAAALSSSAETRNGTSVKMAPIAAANLFANTAGATRRGRSQPPAAPASGSSSLVTRQREGTINTTSAVSRKASPSTIGGTVPAAPSTRTNQPTPKPLKPKKKAPVPVSNRASSKQLQEVPLKGGAARDSVSVDGGILYPRNVVSASKLSQESNVLVHADGEAGAAAAPTTTSTYAKTTKHDENQMTVEQRKQEIASTLQRLKANQVVIGQQRSFSKELQLVPQSMLSLPAKLDQPAKATTATSTVVVPPTKDVARLSFQSFPLSRGSGLGSYNSAASARATGAGASR